VRAGQRVRFTETCPWPERVGLTATVVAPPSDGTYPQPGRSEVLVLIDGDPYGPLDRGWTCVMPVKACEVVA
jgi:hypothetical protein